MKLSRRRLLANMIGSAAVLPLLSTRHPLSPLFAGIAGAEQAGGSPLKIFPEATGFGANSWGGNSPEGKSSRIVLVTNCDDYDVDEAPKIGSLRHALAEQGPRIVLLVASGTIKLKRELEIRQPYVTVTGSFAPTPGAVISGAPIVIKTHDVVLSDLRVRVGDAPGKPSFSDRDCITLSGRADGRWGEKDSVERVYLHRLSLSFSCDELLSTYGAVRDVTVQRCLLSHALRYTNHHDIDPKLPPAPKNHHSMGLLIAHEVERFTFRENIVAFALHRMPRIMPGASAELINNVFYGFGSRPSDRFYFEDSKGVGSRSSRVVVQGNLWIPLDSVSTNRPVIQLGKKPFNPQHIQLVMSDNGLQEKSGSISSLVNEMKPGLGIIPGDKPSQQIELSSLLKLLSQSVGARDKEGLREVYDEQVLKDIIAGRGQIWDTVTGQSHRNGFTLQEGHYSYPRSAVSVVHSQPDHNPTRPLFDAYSDFEKILWRSASKP